MVTALSWMDMHTYSSLMEIHFSFFLFVASKNKLYRQELFADQFSFFPFC